jgi:uncharacterized protein YeaO (DUF488 family)
MMAFAIRRVYEPPGEHDGTRILVDRLWPRGISKDKARIDLWLKDIAPSDTLRKQFHGHAEDWDAFLDAYFAELQDEAAQRATTVVFERLKEGPVMLLYAARDEVKNNAVALRMWLERHDNESGPPI